MASNQFSLYQALILPLQAQLVKQCFISCLLDHQSLNFKYSQIQNSIIFSYFSRKSLTPCSHRLLFALAGLTRPVPALTREKPNRPVMGHS
ncbi:unnamed protein product [Moneuplotes crassus]|uniref:Uncharacterized protein n=1 Tax=Euplotes crassus TaxID=5936 RepID=A0AAD1XJA2_EUPCR|nr:unnamed protein product [Moneuplotes crassus]